MKRLTLLAILAALPVADALATDAGATIVVGRREVELTYAAEATLEAVRQATVAAQVAGRILDVKAEAGQSVRQGQTLMRIDAANGVVEIGNIYWGPLIARKAAATEALYLFAHYAFDVLGYRRFEWKCNNDNVPSKKAAVRFGFQPDGVFRQHLVVKGLNRDTAWFPMTDKDRVKLKPAYEAWLSPENFDATGQQKLKLEEIREQLAA